MMKTKWLLYRILFIFKQTPRRVWRLFTFWNHPFYRIYPPSVKWTAAGLLLTDLIFFFDFFEIISNLFSPNSRLLTAIEKERCQENFGTVLDSNLIMYDKRSIPVKKGMAHAYVTFNTINSWRPIRADIFVHELTHIWQYQNFGAGYIAAALAAQKTAAGYNYTFTEGWYKGSFFDLNAEQQADFVQDTYLKKKGYYPQYFVQNHVNESGVHERFLKEMNTNG
jgi:hypothetical protein